MSNYAWLCDYLRSEAHTYGMVIQTVDYDDAERFFLEKKKKYATISDVESLKLEQLQNLGGNFYTNWEFCNYIKNLPIKLLKEPDINYSNLPKKDDIMFIITNGYLIFSKKLYSIISQFNLGKTHFSQVYIYDIETKEQLSDVPYYFINIAEKFEFLNSNKSKGIKANRYCPEDPLRYIWGAEDDDIVLSESAKNIEMDLWHDPLLNNSLFFSDRLAKALLDNGFTQEELGLIRCVIT